MSTARVRVLVTWWSSFLFFFPCAPWVAVGTNSRRAPQVLPEHMGEEDFLEGEALAAAWQKQRDAVNAAVKRKLSGELEKTTEKPPKKRRRLKTYSTIMSIDSMLRGTCCTQLSNFIVPKTPEGEFCADSDPFTWPVLSVATDSGPDCTAAAHFLLYSRGCCLQWEFDLSHSLNNATKLALKCAFSFLRSCRVSAKSQFRPCERDGLCRSLCTCRVGVMVWPRGWQCCPEAVAFQSDPMY